MSELLQSGQHPGAAGQPDPFGHPDADQLSAFIDQALPTHERESVLAHLAICPDCRETVALSLPSTESLPIPAAAPVRKSRFSGWTVLVPAAAALAAVAFFVVYIDRTPTGAGKEQAQIAVPQRPEPIQTPAQSANAIAAAPSPNSPAAGRELRSRRHPAGAQGKATRQARALDQPLASPPRGISEESKNSGVLGELSSGTGAGLEAGYGGTAAAPASAFAKNLPQNSPRAAAAPTVAPALQGPPAPAAAPVAPVAASTQSVQVASEAAPIETTSAEMKDLNVASSQAEAPLLLRALPSRLKVVSSANFGARVLAIDARNAVFLSLDSGQHWKTVRAPWPGRAVKADLVSMVAAARLSAAATKAASQPAPVFAITTDTGDRWTSPDGLTWKRD